MRWSALDGRRSVGRSLVRVGPAAERNLVLTGFMGTGKTTVGRILADRLGYGFVDTDEVIESRAGPIGEIFERDGEEVFRQLERSVARELAGRTGLVIATGGRMMLDASCSACLEPAARVVCLTAHPDIIVERIGGTGRRPLLDVPDAPARVRELLAERAEGYARFASVETDDRSPGEVADAVRWRRRGRANMRAEPAGTGGAVARAARGRSGQRD